MADVKNSLTFRILKRMGIIHDEKKYGIISVVGDKITIEKQVSMY